MCVASGSPANTHTHVRAKHGKPLELTRHCSLHLAHLLRDVHYQFTTRAVRLMSFTLPDLRTASMVELVTPDGPPALGVPLPLPLPASALGLADLSFLWAPPADALAATRL